MRRLQGQKSKRKLYSQIALFVSVFLVLVLAKPTWNIWQKYRESEREVKRAKQQLLELKQRKEFLQAELAKLDTKAGIEEEVVKKFDWVQEGEKLAVIVEPEDQAPEKEEEKGKFRAFIEKYFTWFFGKEEPKSE